MESEVHTMIVKNKIGYLLQGRAIADAERKTSKNGKDYVSILRRVGSRRAPEGSKYTFQGEILNLSCSHELADAALCIQKGDMLDVWVHDLDKREKQNGKTYYYASAAAMVLDLRAVLRVIQTYSNAVPMTPTDIPSPYDYAPETDRSAPLADADTISF